MNIQKVCLRAKLRVLGLSREHSVEVVPEESTVEAYGLFWMVEGTIIPNTVSCRKVLYRPCNPLDLCLIKAIPTARSRVVLQPR